MRPDAPTSTPTPDARTCVRCSLTRWYAGPWNDHSLQSCDEIIAARAEGEKAATKRIVAFLERHADMWGECSADCLETLRDYITTIREGELEANDA